jgi:drug/metabolite transporter (DMT)-like permease
MNESDPPATEAEPSAPSRLPASALLLLVLVIVMWGASYPTMKAAALEIPLVTFRGWSALIPALIMLALARAMGHTLRVPRACWLELALTGICTVTFTHTLTTMSTLYIASGQTSLMLYTMPIWVAIISIPVLGERPTRAHWLGVSLGVGGIVLLWSQTADGGFSIGVFLGLISAITWSIGTIAAKSVSGRLPSMVMTGWSFLIGALPLCLYGLTEIDQLGPVSPRALWSAVFLTFGANFLGFLAFFHIIRLVPAVVASLSILAVPGVSFAVGVFLVDEVMTLTDVVAFVLIAGALTTVLPKPSLKRRNSSPD